MLSVYFRSPYDFAGNSARILMDNHDLLCNFLLNLFPSTRTHSFSVIIVHGSKFGETPFLKNVLIRFLFRKVTSGPLTLTIACAVLVALRMSELAPLVTFSAP